MKAACAKPVSSFNLEGNCFAATAAPLVTTCTLSPWWKVAAATRAGGFGKSNATRPSTVTVVESWTSMRSMTASPSGLYGRTANATANGTRERFSISTIANSSSPAIAYARWTASPPGMRSVVSTTGVESTSPCRIRDGASREGTYHRSSAPIHQSSDQPSNHVVTRPRGSTIGSTVDATLPIAVQFRAVTLVRNGRWPRGTKADDVGSSWFSSQYGHTQSGPICAAALVRSARNTVRAPIGSISPG